MERRTEKVFSKDGTPIAFERSGKGPALILVDGALCSREFGPMPELAPVLARRYTVFVYDRRGRGGSGDTRPYALERELEDLDALIRAAGGRALVAGLSSGGGLALEAAAAGLPIEMIAAYEPPYVAEAGAGHQARLEELVAADRRGAALEYFMRRMVGAPAAMVLMMRLMPGPWRKLKAVAHTLPYDAAVMRDFAPVERARLASIAVPTLVLHGGKSDPRLVAAARAVAEAVPGARLRALAGQSHRVKPEVLAAALEPFFGVEVPAYGGAEAWA
jgi:pimeloyl-ACP methyl ester carboxylesterase